MRRRSVPSYRKHKPSGQAVVTLSGQDFYLGPHSTNTSKAEYDRRVAEWLARGRRPVSRHEESQGVTVVELIVAYKRFAETYYRKNGKPTNEFKTIMIAAKVVKDHYGREPANGFGPLKLQAVQQTMIRLGWCRAQINKQIGRIVRMFAWGVSQELVAAGVAQALREVKGLHKGRTTARESEPVLPVTDTVVNATLDSLPPIVAAMVRLQRLTGCRPEEVCLLRPCDVDTAGPVWAYRPESHKTAHHNRQRVIFIGPKGQDVLRPYLLRDKQAYCFCPAEGERQRRSTLPRVTPAGRGNEVGTNRKRSPERTPGDRYTTDSYRRAIHRACEIAFRLPTELKPPSFESPEAKATRLKELKKWRYENCWAPNQLRHSAATEIRKKFGLEAAQVTLGHASADISQVYAERDMEKAAAVMREVG